MANKKRRTNQRIIIGVSFLFFSIILVVNNTTQLLQTFGIKMSSPILFIVSIIGVLASAIWAIVLAAIGEFN